MLGWSYNFVIHALDQDGYFTFAAFGGLVVASLNMLVQVFLSIAFGDKSVLKVGGKR